LAVVIGAATHVGWDAFTHEGRWGMRLLPWLDATALTIAGYAIPGYKVFQYGSTAVGLPLLAAMAVAWLSRQPPAPLESLPSVPRAVRAAIVLAAVMIPALVTLPNWGGEAPFYGRIGRAIRDSGLALMIAVFAYGLAFRTFAGSRPPAGEDHPVERGWRPWAGARGWGTRER
jgi:hypothetical protein